ncbi:hypothetical protein EV356DRAFT_536694 [Viridothelium virens]|uniref:Methyltransferase domain-containing protein n=1 Tax=Viridothelium virens TaxID=1048519 RepID=A0A6A6GX20_VIRVR|nr:hypothetical protein EV356DRAFT_536694 [Viridothelium virens]
MPSNEDGYMLRRDHTESQRLDAQHQFFRTLSGGHLVHPSIPWKLFSNVADVAAGTGIWLRQLAQSTETSDTVRSFVGFDISAQQYPSKDECQKDGIELLTHDMTKPFPQEYHQKFELVNVRFVSYVMKATELDNVVGNIVQLLRPGGYLQWQECDAGDSWTTPETTLARSTINYTIEEKIARGLLPGIATPLIRTIQSLQTEIPRGQHNPNSFSSDQMRLKQIETVSTATHPDPIVAAGKKMGVISAATVLLESSIQRKRSKAAQDSTPSSEKEQLERDVQAMSNLMEAIKCGEDDAVNNWDFEMTWIVARKAIPLSTSEPWMAIKYPQA